MKQILQNIRSGELSVAEVPPPAMLSGCIRMKTAASLISAGTEKMLIDLAQKSLAGKARARPDLVKQVLRKVQKEGLMNTFRNVSSKLEKPMALGYSAAGVITDVDDGVGSFQPGDRVAVAGAGYANHAHVNVVPENLVAAIPDNVSFEDAAYVTVAAIALQGVRLTKPELGDNVAVVGLGLIGLITVQLLKANGCRVIGFDLDPARVKLALEVGAEAAYTATGDEANSLVDAFTGGRGVDHTLITAATKSNAPIELAGEITRKKGQVVVVGAVGMDVPRNSYYHKELSLQVSMSYGPGRYDPLYEEGGIDYPYDYVRWTEQRNMEAVLQLMSSGQLDVGRLTTHSFEIGDALGAYEIVKENTEPHIGILLTYDMAADHADSVQIDSRPKPKAKDQLGVSFVGAGNYAALHLIPHLAADKTVALGSLMTATGMNAKQKAEKFGFDTCTTDLDALLKNPSTDAVFIATRHSTHASYTRKALEARKHVFVEKPVVVAEDELAQLEKVYRSVNEQKRVGLMVGLNRRFAPMVASIRKAFSSGHPIQMVYRVNSGHIPTDTWLHDGAEGGGMMIGEMCHFVDLMQFLASSRPDTVVASRVATGRSDVADNDNVTILVNFENGSTGTLVYNTVGDKGAPKERLEVFGGGNVAMLDDFRELELHVRGKRSRDRSAGQDKGQKEQLRQTIESFRVRGEAPIPFQEIIDGMRIIFAARRSIATGSVVRLRETPEENLSEHAHEEIETTIS